VILVDSDVPMYLIGEPHRHKIDAQQLLEQCISRGERLVSDAEVLQEIPHRYTAINRRDAIQAAFDVAEVLPITLEDTLRAREIVLGSTALSARDAIHLAVMERNDIAQILSFDRWFDGFPGTARIGG
jgi:predicted nucleic acid-binding protein